MNVDEQPAEDALDIAPNGDVLIPLDEKGTIADLETLTYDDDEPNLVFTFQQSKAGRDALAKIGDIVYRDYTQDWESSSGYREAAARDMRVLYAELEKKTFPWADCANAHVPSTFENVTRICARMDSEVFGDWTNVFGVLPVGSDDEDIAQALTLHGNWQIREKQEDFPRQMSRGILSFVFSGDVTCYTYWDPFRRVNCNDVLTPDEFVTPYVYTTTRPDYSDLPHYTLVLRRYRHELEKMKKAWYGVEELLDRKAPSFDSDPDEPMREGRAQIEEINAPTDATSAPYKLLQYEGWLTLPERDDQRWCKVILDYHTKSVLCLSIHEEVNWQDKLRWEQQTAEHETFIAGMQAHQDASARVAMAGNALEAALPEMGPEQAALAQSAHQQASAMVPPPPSPPPWMNESGDPPEMPRRDPLYMFSHGVCIESLTGNLGLGFSKVQVPLNIAQNVLMNQFIDAATINNCGVYLTTDGFELDSPMEFAPGKFLKVTGMMPGGIAANVMQLQFPPANPQMIEMVKIFGDMAQSSLQAPGVLSGEPGKSGETYRGLASRVEQATKQLSVPARAFCRFLKKVLQNNAKLNATYLDDDEIANVLDQSTGQWQQVRATKEMYARNYQVTINADLRFASQTQRIAEADELVAMPSGVPALQSNLAFQYYTAVKALQARGRADVIPYLGAPPPKSAVFGQPSFPPGTLLMVGPDGRAVPAGPPGMGPTGDPGGGPPGASQGPPSPEPSGPRPPAPPGPQRAPQAPPPGSGPPAPEAPSSQPSGPPG